MKHPSAVTEIIILVSMIAAWVPLFMVLMHAMNNSEYTWMRDKTIMDNAVSIEWIEREYEVMEGGVKKTVSYLVPNIAESAQYNKADILLSLVIFDRYAPDTNIVSIISASEEAGVGAGTEFVNYVDMTDAENYQNKYDYLNFWYQPTGLDISGRADVPYYLNWINYTDKDGSKVGMWAFRENYDLRYEE